MPMTVEQLVHEAAALPCGERTNLIERLLIEFGNPDTARTDDEWRAIARRRWEEVENGTAKTIPGEEVFAKLDRLLGK
jgi:putative addiction module component (TIGR02574 family)